MTKAQRWLAIAALLICSAGFALFFVEIRSDNKNLVYQAGLIFPLGESTRDPPPWEKSDWKIVTQVGIYARPGRQVATAAAGGLLVPFLLICIAGYLALGDRQKSN